MHGHLPVEEYVPPAADTSAMTLTQLADHYKTDKGNIKHRYTEIYDRYLGALRDKPINLLEIGVANGCSLKMWSDYFPAAKITGMDIRPECASLCKGFPRISIIVGNAAKVAAAGPFDVIVDDGSHISQDIVETFFLQWPKVRKGGFYFIEDLKPTYNPSIWPFFPHYEKSRFNRGHFMGLVDFLMQNADRKQGSEIEFLNYSRELLAIRKASDA